MLIIQTPKCDVNYDIFYFTIMLNKWHGLSGKGLDFYNKLKETHQNRITDSLMFLKDIQTKSDHLPDYEGCRQLIGIACLAATMCMFFNLNVLGLLTQVYYIQSYLHVTYT